MFGAYVKEKRLGRGITLREFSKIINYDPSNWSKIERGTLSPPQDDEKLTRIAEALNIEYRSHEWQQFIDEAKISAGMIPDDIVSDEQVVKSLPLFFRTVRRDKPTEEELDTLIKILKRER